MLERRTAETLADRNVLADVNAARIVENGRLTVIAQRKIPVRAVKRYTSAQLRHIVEKSAPEILRALSAYFRRHFFDSRAEFLIAVEQRFAGGRNADASPVVGAALRIGVKFGNAVNAVAPEFYSERLY